MATIREVVEAAACEVEFRRRERAVKYWADPVGFSATCLGFQPWHRQAEIMAAVSEHEFVSVRSGQKIGKSRLASAIAVWWVMTRENGFVVLTAPTFAQVKNPLWSELRSLVADAPVWLADADPALDPATGWQLGPKRMVMGRTTTDPKRIQGLSGADILFIVDEASGYPEPLFAALLGNMAGGGRMLLIGNPNELSGTFYDSHHTKRHLWHTIHVSSLETPNFHGGKVPGLAGPDWLKRQVEDWGPDSEAYQVRALGEFPSASSDAVISLRSVTRSVEERQIADRMASFLGFLRVLVLSAKGRSRPALNPEAKILRAFDTDKGLLHIGVDVGRGGDDTVIVPRRGYTIGTIAAFNGAASEDGAQVADRVMLCARALRRPGELPFVKVDIIGYGASAYDHLKPYALGRKPEIALYGVNSGQRSDDEERFYNLRSQLHFGLRDWLRDGGQLPDDSRLGGEIIAAKWKNDPRGRVKVQLKDEIKKTLGRSPDRSDALMMAVYDRAIGYVGDLPPIQTMVSPMQEA